MAVRLSSLTAEVIGLEGLVQAGYEVVVDAELVAGDGWLGRSTASAQRWLAGAAPRPLA